MGEQPSARGTLVDGQLRRRGFHLETQPEPMMRGTDLHVVYATRR